MMARKTKEDAEQTYSTLLDAAEIVFRERGVAAATLNDIATAAGMTRGAIYWHFKDKGELLQAMCDRATLPMEAMLGEAVLVSTDDPLGSLQLLCVQNLKLLAQSPRQHTVFDILFHKCEKTGEMAAMFEREKESRKQCHGRAETLLKQAVKLGQLPSDTDTEIAMRALHGYIVGLMHEWLLAPETYDLAKHAEPFIQIMIAGLRASPPRKRVAARTRVFDEKIAFTRQPRASP
jgi:TetR/AcrR family transcriptional regulator, acrAB operon repressor